VKDLAIPVNASKFGEKPRIDLRPPDADELELTQYHEDQPEQTDGKPPRCDPINSQIKEG
jgi:hypothetical protein